MIRHHESLGLFPQAARTKVGYRQCTDKDINTLRFIRHSRDLGFSLEQIRDLLGLWQNRKRSSRQVRALAQAHLDELNAKLAELQAMKGTLEHLVNCCQGDERPECPISEGLEGEGLVSQRLPALGVARMFVTRGGDRPDTGPMWIDSSRSSSAGRGVAIQI